MSFLTTAFGIGAGLALILILMPRLVAYQRLFLQALGVAILAYITWLLVQSIFGLTSPALEANATDFALGALTILGLRAALNVIIERAKRR